MANTFNRQPSLVNLPNSNVISNNFFVHHNWSGVNENRNVLNVDQQSFSDSLNVWVDEKGVLRSRPALKIVDELVIDVFIFGEVKITVTKLNPHVDDVNIRIYNAYVNSYVDRVVQEYHGYTIIPWKSKLLMWDNFNKLMWYVYDIHENTLKSFDDYIYIPTTKVIHNSVIESLESANELTESYKTRYILDSATNISQLDSLSGKRVNVTLGEDEYDVEFNDNTIDSLSGKYCKINRNVLNSDFFGGVELPLIDVSDNGVMLICEYEHDNNIDSYRMYFTIDGTNINYVPVLSGMINRPRLTRDGHHIVAFTEDGAYILTIIPTNIVEETFGQWTNLLYHNGYYSAVRFNTHMPDEGLHQNVLIDGHFIDSLNFVIAYATCDVDIGGYNLVHNLICEDGTIREILCYREGTDAPGAFVNTTGGIKTVCRYENGIKTGTIIPLDNNETIIVYTDSDDAIVKYDNISLTRNANYYNHRNVNESDINLIISNGKTVGLSFYICEFDGWHRVIANDDGYVEHESRIHSQGRIRPIRDNGVNVLDGRCYYNGELVDLLNRGIAVALLSNNIHFVLIDDWVYSNAILSRVTAYIDCITAGHRINIFPEHFISADNIYISNGNTTYISSDVEDKLYFPSVNRQEHDFNISNLHQISEDKIAVFFNDRIDYITKKDGEYYYDRSKLPIGILNGSDVLTVNDGKYTLFPSERGLAIMGYQDFVATSEQSVNYLTDDLMDRWLSFSKNGNVKMLQNKFWIFMYNGTNDVFVLDIRNNALWPWRLPIEVTKLYYDSTLRVLNQNDMMFTYDDEYADITQSGRTKISWHIASQKLHLDAPNHYKHITNFTFNSSSDRKFPLSLKLDVKNYRKQINDGIPELFDYEIDTIRTFVKRVNYSKVCEFQYRISSDDDSYLSAPFEVSAITIKYKITGQVR